MLHNVGDRYRSFFQLMNKLIIVKKRRGKNVVTKVCTFSIFKLYNIFDVFLYLFENKCLHLFLLPRKKIYSTKGNN